MVSIGEAAEKAVNSAPVKGQVLDANFIGNRLEFYGYSKIIAGEQDFTNAVNALCVSAGSCRGILVTGVNGCGKSKFLHAVSQLLITPKHWVNCYDEESVDWLMSGALFSRHVFLDDLGSERFKYGDYDIVGEFICRWYERHRPDRYLFVSTNLTGAQIDERYGGRVFDRLREECVILQMRGETKREEIVIG